jgi:hypothetical protein
VDEKLEKISALSVLNGTGKFNLARMAALTGWQVTSLTKRISWENRRNLNFALALELLAEKGLLLELERKIRENRDVDNK